MSTGELELEIPPWNKAVSTLAHLPPHSYSSKQALHLIVQCTYPLPRRLKLALHLQRRSQHRPVRRHRTA